MLELKLSGYCELSMNDMPSHYADLYIALYATTSAALPYLISHICCILGIDLHTGMYTVQTDTAQQLVRAMYSIVRTMAQAACMVSQQQ